MEEFNRNDLRMRCIRIAVHKVKNGKYEEAIRFLEIVQRRCHENSNVVEEFIDDLKYAIQKRSILSSRNIKSSGDNTNCVFIESQLLLVREVLRQQNFYQILNVRTNATEREIRKSYKRLLLQLHPDKNCAPDAAIAFQLISKAFAVLSDEKKRREYDAAGACGITFNEPDNTKHPHSTNQNDKKFKFGRFLVDLLFSTSDSVPKSMQTFSGTTTKTLLGSLLVAVFLAFATSILTQSNQLFSFSETSKFNVRQVTHRLRVPYFVKADFLETYKGDLTKFEKEVETQFVTIADMTCKNERRERDNALIRARQAGNRWEYARIFSIRLKSCDILVRLGLYRFSTPGLTSERWNS